MGKFDGVLLVSDFDNTLVFTRKALSQNGVIPPIPPYNVSQIRYFMDNGGIFALVTGRTWQLIRNFLPQIPTNAPCGIGNGAGLVDIPTGRLLYENNLPPEIARHMDEVLAAFPRLCCEICRGDNQVDAINPLPFTYRHAKTAGYEFRVVSSLRESPLPLVKLLFEADEHRDLVELEAFIRSRPWAGCYELIYSSDILLEMVARGADKGALVRRLAERFAIDSANIYCVGDHDNDLSMLRLAREGFAPANAAPGVLAAGFTQVCHCEEGAVGQVIALLDQRY